MERIFQNRVSGCLRVTVTSEGPVTATEPTLRQNGPK
jgi:hypothetical protein